ncbi:hypothetical protein CRG98_029711 [Punica granatum]|uniref:Uncharacterized protein n=1 Tax=Punica granatum TaxID=22663 RepID=A0A2I0J0X7_PUNGR|nr:hypothetical protein CRG98_029711 [Punica granatum]
MQLPNGTLTRRVQKRRAHRTIDRAIRASLGKSQYARAWPTGAFGGPLSRPLRKGSICIFKAKILHGSLRRPETEDLHFTMMLFLVLAGAYLLKTPQRQDTGQATSSQQQHLPPTNHHSYDSIHPIGSTCTVAHATNNAWPACPCIFYTTLSFKLRKFAEPARSCFLQCRMACSPMHLLHRTFFFATQVRRACSLVLLATPQGLLARASFLLSFASLPSLLARASCNSVGPARLASFTPQFLLSCASSPSLLARASYNSVGPARPCILSFSCTSSPSPLAHASCNSVGPARPCILSFKFYKFAETARLCFLQLRQACLPVHLLHRTFF